MQKRLEDLAVKVAVVEKIYHVSQEPLETLMKVIDEQKAVIIKMNKMLKKHEKIILAMRENSKKQVASNGAKVKTAEDSDGKITEKESGNIAGSTGERVAVSEIESKKISKSDTEKPDSQNLTEIGKGIFAKNITLKQFSSSTKISGEVINMSNTDYSTAKFRIQFYEKDGKLLKSHKLSVLNFKIGNTKNFDELIPGIELKTIARYDILIEDSKLATSTDKEKIKMYDKKPEAALTETKAEQPQSVKEKSVEVAAATTPDKSKDFKAIGNGFYVRGVTFSEFGSSSIMKGELKNGTRRDMASVSFSMKFSGKDGDMIAEAELSIISFKSNEVKPFEQLISDVHPSQISEYEIVCKKKL